MSDFMLSKGIGGHHRGHRGRTDDWITPKSIINALGPFDLDPCACKPQPWPTATTMWTLAENGWQREWYGRVWLNPPYGPVMGRWLDRLAEHGDGIALIFARTETAAFQKRCWARANAMLFLAGRINFHFPDGRRADKNAGGPSVLVAYGDECERRIRECGIPGARVRRAEMVGGTFGASA